MTDLFGNPLQALIDAPLTGPRKRREPTPSGHYLKPGTGPAGETCGSCEWHVAACDNATPVAYTPTHWQPLPEPPALQTLSGVGDSPGG